MKSVIFCALLTVAVAAPQYNANYQQYQPQYYRQPQYYQSPPYQSQQYYSNPQSQYYSKSVPIVSQTNQIFPDGSFKYGYITGDGQQVQASSYVKSTPTDKYIDGVQGSYSYKSPDGQPIVTSYIADENGFRAQGAHIPTPPPIPAAILRSLAYNAQAEKTQYKPQYDDQGKYQPYQQYNPYRTYKK